MGGIRVSWKISTYGGPSVDRWKGSEKVKYDRWLPLWFAPLLPWFLTKLVWPFHIEFRSLPHKKTSQLKHYAKHSTVSFVSESGESLSMDVSHFPISRFGESDSHGTHCAIFTSQNRIGQVKQIECILHAPPELTCSFTFQIISIIFTWSKWQKLVCNKFKCNAMGGAAVCKHDKHDRWPWFRC